MAGVCALRDIAAMNITSVQGATAPATPLQPGLSQPDASAVSRFQAAMAPPPTEAEAAGLLEKAIGDSIVQNAMKDLQEHIRRLREVFPG